MTSAPGRGQRPIRVGNCSGFYGDRASAMADMARAGGIDVLTGDYLAEVTMLILGKARAKDSTKGYATTFLQHVDAALDHLVANGIRLVVNAGGLNPAGLADATRALIAGRGYDLQVSHIGGDDVFGSLDELQQTGHSLPHLTTGEPLSSWPHRPLTANAYLGGFGIARALARGADIVITGRVADAALVVGPAAWWWNWAPDDYDALAGAVAAGHVIECGPQATGGNFSGFRNIANFMQPGFPIAEIDTDGSSVITKNPGTGGAVTHDTVTAQLLYEIGEPAYLNPDVIAHLDTAELTDLGDDRVRIRGVRGSAPPATTKVAITGVGGWENSMILALTGTDLDAKAALVERFVHREIEAADGLDAVTITRIGQARHDPDSQNAGTALLQIAVQGTKEAAGRAFSSRMVELALSSYPGLYTLGPPQPGSAFGVYWPALLDQRMLDHMVHHHDGTTEIIAPGTPHDGGLEAPPPVELFPAPSVRAPWTDAPLVIASLGEIVHARSGDKGGDANLGVWVRDRGAWQWLQSTLTVDELRRLLPETHELAISRYELPKLGAVNFLIRGMLGSGATSTLRLDSQAKALGEWLRARNTKVPRSLLNTSGAHW
ncbi:MULTISPECIES: acyclic terpene utilization AtuA family protein [unclassified Rhodococcus (in: high G+C Gram-positive bacteria)]|uniref:acyclic terpene utilization AtuA family protein n=1 Tax=unclassified Rhodococcus (in: high G+C Gram-positive bacteria) TaxID=192944 RepID=UPI0002DA273D|nr:acyclic terpene utilization AtuA family protein [Rhodococcus sp. DK17]